MIFGVPQVIYLALMGLSLGVEMTKHGQPKTGKHNFGVMLIALAIQIALMRWGGFFG